MEVTRSQEEQRAIGPRLEAGEELSSARTSQGYELELWGDLRERRSFHFPSGDSLKNGLYNDPPASIVSGLNERFLHSYRSS